MMMRFPPWVKYLLPRPLEDEVIFELVLKVVFVVVLRAFTRRQQPPDDNKDDTDAFCEKKPLMMTEKEREFICAKNEDKMERIRFLHFFPGRKRGSVSVAFLQIITRFRFSRRRSE